MEPQPWTVRWRCPCGRRWCGFPSPTRRVDRCAGEAEHGSRRTSNANCRECSEADGVMALHPVFGTPLPEDWRTVRVDDIKAPEASSCVAGPFGSNIASKYFVPEGVPVIRGS